MSSPTSTGPRPRIRRRSAFARWVDVIADCAGLVATQRMRASLDALDQAERDAAKLDPRRAGVFMPGDEVVYSARFVQLAFRCLVPVDEPVAVFIVRACSCAMCDRGEHICTEDWLADYGVHRHLHRDAVRHRGAVHTDDLCVAPPIVIPRVGNLRSQRLPKP